MKLSDFLISSRKSRAAFAKELGVSEVSITRYINGSRTPRLPELIRIQKITDGAVTPNDFLPLFRGDESAAGAARPHEDEAPAEDVNGELVRIEEITKGAVRAKDFLPAQPAPSRSPLTPDDARPFRAADARAPPSTIPAESGPAEKEPAA